MNILLFSGNPIAQPMPVFPLGLLSLSKAIKDAGHKVDYVDILWEENPEKVLQKAVKDKAPDIVLMSIRNSDDYCEDPPIITLPLLRDLIEFIKEMGIPGNRIVVGGCAVNYIGESLLRYLGVEYGCFSEGEQFVTEFINKIQNDEDVRDIPNLMFFDNGKFIKNDMKVIPENKIGRFDWDIVDNRYVEMGNKYGLKATPSIQSKRGCPYKCIYCNVPIIEGKKIRCRNPKDVVDEIEGLSQIYQGAEIEFIDNDFNIPKSHAEEICREIIRRKLTIKWSCALQPAMTTQDFLKLLKEANCVRVDLGVESCSIRMMRNLNRPVVSHRHLINIVEWCNKLELKLYLACCLGGPGESYYTLKENFEVLDSMPLVSHDGYPTTIFYGGLRIYPNTEIARIAVEEGVIWRDHPLLFPEYYLSKGMDEKAFEILMEYKEKRWDWLFKGTALHRWIGEMSERGVNNAIKIRETTEEKEPVAKKTELTKNETLFKTLDDEEVSIKKYEGKNIIMVVGSQQNNEDMRKWYVSFKDKFTEKNRVVIQALGSIPELPKFLTKEFIKNQLRTYLNIVDNVWLDWDAEYVVGELGLELDKKTNILCFNKMGNEVFRAKRNYSEADSAEMIKEIQYQIGL